MTCRQKKAVIKKKVRYIWYRYPIRQYMYNNFFSAQILINTLNQGVRLQLKYKEDFYAKSKQLKIISNV